MNMYSCHALALLNVALIIHVTSGKPLDDQGGLLVMENAHKYHNDLRNVEAEAHFNLETFLENLKADILRSLNLTEMPSQEKTEEEPPQIMIDLYNRYTKDTSSSPISNIVRSFSPEDVASLTSWEMNPFQRHTLFFNVSIPRHEEVTRAELRLHIACPKERRCFPPLQGSLAIYDAVEGDPWEKPQEAKSSLLWKEIQECGWVMFDVSGTVKRWVKAEKPKSTSGLEIAVENHIQSDLTCGKVHVSVTPNSNCLPLLIVFSNDHSKRLKENRIEPQEMMVHEQESKRKNVVKSDTVQKLTTVSASGIHHASSRSKRSAEISHCRRTSLHVNFKEIGWTWIIAPQDYEAFECKGGCFFPLTDNVTPTKHAIVQTLVHYKNPKKAGKVCCVPTKLDAISMLYKDDAGIPTLKYQYEGMKVAECGCR